MSLIGRDRTSSRLRTSLCAAIVASAALGTFATAVVPASARPARTQGGQLGVTQALSSAAALTIHADHLLVLNARALATCVSEHPRPSRCRATRRAVQASGSRLSRAQRHLSRIARSTSGAHAADAGVARRAPELSIAGDRLTWNRNPRLNIFVLVRTMPGQAPQYSVIHGTSTVPPPVPGITVDYRVRTAEQGSSWSDWRQIAYSEPTGPPILSPTSPSTETGVPTAPSSTETGDAQAAPTITLSADTLTWRPIANVQTYVLVSKLASGAETYSVIAGTTTTPPTVPGTTVRYSVRTAVDGSAWSPEVAISYPAETSGQPAPEAPGTGAEPQPQPKAGNFQPGLVSGTNMNEDLQGAVLLGAKLVRVGFSIATTTQEMEPVIAGYASKGIRVQPLAEFYGRMPSPAEAQGLASWARAFGPGGTFWAGRSDGSLAIEAIEFGNETDSGAQYNTHAGEAAYTTLAETYATRLREAGEVVSATGTGVGLLAEDDDETGDWMRGMYAAVPDLTRYVSGWTIHPYGGEQYNRERMALLISQTAEHGASKIPIDITEWGVSTDNGDCVNFNEGLNTCMSYEEAAHTLQSTVAWIKQLLGERLGDFFLYQVRDQQPAGRTSNWQDYFGVLQHELQPKGAYTAAARALLSS
jgi:hypothetical protein